MMIKLSKLFQIINIPEMDFDQSIIRNEKTHFLDYNSFNSHEFFQFNFNRQMLIGWL